MAVSRSAPLRAVEVGWKKHLPLRPRNHARALLEGVQLLSRAQGKIADHPLALPEQPFDRLLLRASPLFRRSRELFNGIGGSFHASLLSSPRSLGSAALLGSRIQYSPIESELIWRATDALERRNTEALLALRTYTTSLFHEQNHRILWSRLPPAPRDPAGLRRYLNYAEALVITLDMAVGDELGPALSGPFYLAGALYDPGTTVKRELLRSLGNTKAMRRAYRNYLHAALHATYLILELYEPGEIARAIEALFPMTGPHARRAAERSANLDREFIANTNSVWQRRNRASILKALAGPNPLALPADPSDTRLQYLIAEETFSAMGL